MKCPDRYGAGCGKRTCNRCRQDMPDCPDCDGQGEVAIQGPGTIEGGPTWRDVECGRCEGTGKVYELEETGT
jgi:DnaJ-class molecular chaperone